jgi:hypothetical protein
VNGSHTLTAVARDGSGNIATSPNVVVTVTNTTQPPGLVAAYGFDQGSGSSAPDASGTGNCGTLTNGATWSRSGAENAGGHTAVDERARRDAGTRWDGRPGRCGPRSPSFTGGLAGVTSWRNG